MKFEIIPGIPEVANFLNELSNRCKNGLANNDEISLHKKLKHTFELLSNNPKHSSLNSHEIGELTARYGKKVFTSYVENNTPSAKRIYWVYGPNKEQITIISIEPHPNDKSNAYKKIKLSKEP